MPDTSEVSDAAGAEADARGPGAPAQQGASNPPAIADPVDEAELELPDLELPEPKLSELELSALDEAEPDEADLELPEPDEPDVDEADLDEAELELSEMEAQLLDDMDRLQAERNDYLDQLLRTRADFDNYRKRIHKQQSEYEKRAAESLVEKLLDVLDTFDMAVAHGQGYEQVRGRLVFVLAKEGLERIDPAGETFDPNEAEAVAHEAGDGGPVVAEVLRAGYRWKGRVLRPAMVRVKG